MSGDIKGTLTKIKGGSVQNRLAAIGALFSLASDDDIREEIRNMGGIGTLVGCLEDNSDPRIPRQACGALLNMANDDQCREEIRDYGGVELMLKLIENQFKDSTSVEYATGALLNLSSDDDTREMVREADGARILSRCLSDAPSEESRRNSVGAIAQLCFDQEFTKQLVSSDALKHIVECLNSQDEETRNRTSGCIWNLSVTADETREALAREGCLENLVGLLQRSEDVNEDPETVGNCVMCLSILSSNDMVAETLREMDGCFELIVKLLSNPDATIAQNSAAAVWNLAHNDDNKKVLANLDTMASLIPLLDSFNSASDWEALEKVLGAVLTSSTNDSMADQFRENSGFGPLKTIIEGKVDQTTIQNEQHKKCVLYGIIGFAVLAYNDKNKDEIRECGALADLIELLGLEYDDDLLEKVTAAILNLTHNIENRVAIRKLDGIAPLIELLYHPNETISMNAAGCLWNLSNDEACKAVIRSLGGLKPLLALIGGGKVQPRSKKDRKISKEAIEAANRLLEGEEESEPVPEEKFDVMEFVENIFNPKKDYENLDEEDGSSDKKKPQVNRNGEQRTTTGAGVEYGEETGMTPAKIIVGAARIDIKNRRKVAEAEREKKEAEEREARRKEREERERERKRKEEEEKKKKEEEEKKRQKEEEERKKKLEAEMKKKAEEEAEKERLRLLAEAEQTKNQALEAFNAKHKRKGVKDEDIDWDEIYQDGFTPSATKDEAKDKLESQIDEYSNIIDPFNSNGVYDQLTPDDIKFIESEIERAKRFLAENPNATKEQIDDARRELDANVKPIIERAKARKVLGDMTTSIRDRLLNDSELLNNLTPEERKELEQAVAEMEQWLRDHPDATKEEIEEKERELLAKIKPILARAATRNDLENYAHDLRKKAANEDDDIDFDLLGDEDKGTFRDAIKEIEDFLLEHPNASAQDIEDKKDEVKRRIDPILKKAKAKKDLLQYASDMRDRLNNDHDLKKRLTPEEKRAIETALDDFDKWIKNHPNADAESLNKQKQRLKQKLEPIVSRADAHNSLDEYINRTRKRVDDNDDLGDLLDDTDKRTLQKELKDAEDFLKKVEKEPGKFTAEEINNKKKETKEKLAPLIEKGEKRRELKDYASHIRDIASNDNELAEFITPKERKLLENEAKELADWVKNNKKATPQQVEERRKKAEEKVQPILDNANQRKALKETVQRLRDRLNDDKYVEKLKPEEKKALKDAADELSNFLAKNPEASAKEIEQQREKTNEKVQPILDRVREQISLENHVNNVRDKIRDDPSLNKFLSDKEKKAIEKAAQDVEKILASKPSIKDAKKAREDFNDSVKPLLENAVARSKLADHGDKVLDDVLSDPHTSDKDKEAVKKAKKELIDDFLAKNPDATKEQLDQQRKKFDEAVAPITDRINKKKELERKINDIKRKLDDPESAICTKATPEERQYLASKVDELSKFLKDNPNASAKQLEDKIKEFNSQVEPIAKTCEKRDQLEKQANTIRDRLVDPNDDLSKYLSESEKTQLRDATNEALNFLEKNPACSSSEVAQAKKKLDDKTKELVEKAKAKGGLYKRAGGLLSDVNNYGEGGLGGKLNSTEKSEIVDKCNDIINHLNKNPNLSTKQIKEKEKELNKVVSPILGKIKERDNLREIINDIRDQIFNVDDRLEDDKSDTSSDSDNDREDLEDLLDGPIKKSKAQRDQKGKTEKLGNFLSNEEKKKIDETTKQALQAIDSDPNLSISDLKEQARNVKQDTENILKAAKTRSDLNEYLNNIREQVKDEDGMIANHLSEKDKKLIDETINEALNWLNKEGANATPEAVEKKKKQVMEKIDPVIRNAKQRGELESIANKVKQRLEDDVDLTSALTDSDKKVLNNEVQDILDFLQKHPNATPEQIQQKKKQFEERVLPILEKAEARNKLKDLTNELRTRLYDEDDLGNKLSEADKKKVEKLIDEAVDFLETNPDASKEKIDQKRHALESNVMPIIKKGEKAKKAADYASGIRDKLENDSLLKDALTPEEKKLIDNHTKDLLDWIEKNAATATANEISDKERQCKEKVDPILNKAKARNALKEDIDKLREKLNDENKHKFSDKEKKAILDEINKANDYLDTVAKNPNTTSDDIEKKRTELKIATQPLVQKAKQRKELQEYAAGVRDKLQNDSKLTSRMTPEEKKALENAAKDALDWVNKHGDDASLNDLKEKLRQTKAKVEATMQRAEKHQKLEDMANNIKEKVEGDLKDCLSPEEKKSILQEVQKTLDWLNKNKTAPIGEVEAQQRALENKIAPLMEKAQTKKDLADFANNVRDRLKNDKELASLLSTEEKKVINDAVKETLDWLSKNPNASLAELKERKKKLEDVVNNVLGDKEAAENFRNYIDKVLEVLKKNKQVQKNLTEEEKRAIQDFAEEARDWLLENPNATARQIRMEKKRLEEKLGKIKKFKFEIPATHYIGNFSERTRWGDDTKRTKDINSLLGSYIKKGDKTTSTPVKPSVASSSTPQRTLLKPVATPKKLTKEEEEEMKLFDTMKFNKGGLIQAKLQSLMGSVGSAGAVSGSVVEEEEEPAVVYSYAELKNNKQKKYPAGIDINKREQYLNNEEFQQVLKMSRDEFKNLPEFRQTKLKRDAELFAYAYEL